jgi:uncharacterized protein
MNRATKSLLAIRYLAVFTALILTWSNSYAQIPSRPSPPVLVNDLASVFTSTERSELERRLVEFANNTSNQIVIVTLSTLDGNDKAQVAFSIGQNWGVGDSKFNNGLVILVKPKKGSERGEAFIATGYGLEGTLPDAVCKRIVENEMIPFFRQDRYYDGLMASLDVILPIAAGEYNHAQYTKGAGGSFLPAAGVLFFVFIFIISMISKKGGTTNLGGGNKRGPSALDLLLLGSILSSAGRGRSGGFGGGGFGGGGFGGFGGGGFGGGGAGGSW